MSFFKKWGELNRVEKVPILVTTVGLISGMVILAFACVNMVPTKLVIQSENLLFAEVLEGDNDIYYRVEVISPLECGKEYTFKLFFSYPTNKKWNSRNSPIKFYVSSCNQMFTVAPSEFLIGGGDSKELIVTIFTPIYAKSNSTYSDCIFFNSPNFGWCESFDIVIKYSIKEGCGEEIIKQENEIKPIFSI